MAKKTGAGKASSSPDVASYSPPAMDLEVEESKPRKVEKATPKGQFLGAVQSLLSEIHAVAPGVQRRGDHLTAQRLSGKEEAYVEVLRIAEELL